VRERLVHRRTALINQIRGLLLERGIVFAKGPTNLRNQMPSLLEDANQNITPRMRKLLDHLWQEWKTLDCGIERISQDIETIASQDAACQRLRQIPGVGPLVSPENLLPQPVDRDRRRYQDQHARIIIMARRTISN
jgi:transposase